MLSQYYIGALMLIRIGLDAGNGLRASHGPDPTQVQPTQTVTNYNLRGPLYQLLAPDTGSACARCER